MKYVWLSTDLDAVRDAAAALLGGIPEAILRLPIMEDRILQVIRHLRRPVSTREIDFLLGLTPDQAFLPMVAMAKAGLIAIPKLVDTRLCCCGIAYDLAENVVQKHEEPADPFAKKSRAKKKVAA